MFVYLMMIDSQEDQSKFEKVYLTTEANAIKLDQRAKNKLLQICREEGVLCDILIAFW